MCEGKCAYVKKDVNAQRKMQTRKERCKHARANIMAVCTKTNARMDWVRAVWGAANRELQKENYK